MPCIQKGIFIFTMNSNERAFSKWIVACHSATTDINYYFCLDLREQYKQCESRHKSKSKRKNKRTVIMIHNFYKYCGTKQRTKEWIKKTSNSNARYLYGFSFLFLSLVSIQLPWSEKKHDMKSFHWAQFYGRCAGNMHLFGRLKRNKRNNGREWKELREQHRTNIKRERKNKYSIL